ncbi:MAG: YhcH/YjgK/YiaL family protein [Candidatus Pacebacteria bacterium]|nr:YhcH/YjgK/YiaL family protein [Candidatus Paceibacterota bacterium]
MILDHIAQADTYANLHSGLAAACTFLRRNDLADLPDDRYDLDGDRVYAMVSRQATRPKTDAKLEVHRRYIDLHYVVAGREGIGWRSLSDCVTPEAPFDKERDVQLFHDIPDTWVVLQPEHFAVVYPQDAHAPLVGTGDVHKVVIKIACQQ